VPGGNCVRGPRVPSPSHFAPDMTLARGKGDSDRPVFASGGLIYREGVEIRSAHG
jgi:hypothetical protein